jgi:hypothetical protein
MDLIICSNDAIGASQGGVVGKGSALRKQVQNRAAHDMAGPFVKTTNSDLFGSLFVYLTKGN